MWNGILSDIFNAVLNLSVIGSLMIAGVFLIREFCLKKRLLKSSVFVLLWMVILFRMMIPLSLPVPALDLIAGSFGFGWSAAEQHFQGEAADRAAVLGETQRRPAGMDQADDSIQKGGRDRSADKADTSGNEENAAAIGGESARTGTDNNHRSITIYSIASIVWIAGTALMASVLVCAWLGTIVREKKAGAFSYAGWQSVKTMAGVKKEIPVMESIYARAPYVSGVFWPAVILPARMNKDQTSHMDHILMHELTHIRYWDNLKKVIAAVVLCLHWFNPVFWLCWILFLRDLECSCDEKVVKLLGVREKKRYAESLYEFACDTHNALLCHFSSSGKSAVHSRIKRILAGTPKLSFAGVLSFVMAFLLLVTGCAFDPVAKEPGGNTKAKSFLVYAASDGLYRTGLDGSGAELIYEGERLSHPVLSEDGGMVMFREAPEPELSSHAGLRVYHFGLGQGISLEEVSYSYCAGPDDTFLMAALDGKLLKVKFRTVQKDGTDVLEYQTEDLSVWPSEVDQDPNIVISYGNLKCSPDHKYLAYSVDVLDYRTAAEGRPADIEPIGGGTAFYSGGLYVLDLETGEAATVVKSIPSTANDRGNYPVPGTWSRDGKTLAVWDKPQSASLSADGVHVFFYHADTGQKTEYGPKAVSNTGNHKFVLPYDENISFSDAGSIAVLAGVGRDMFYDKEIDLITDYSGASARFRTIESINGSGLIPAMPQLSADGKTLYFAAIDFNDVRGYTEGTWTVEDYQNAYPLKRQLYSVTLEDAGEAETGRITQLTFDPAYRNENPVLLRDESGLVFGRANAEAYGGKTEIWIKDLAGGEEIKLAEWTEPETTDPWMAQRYNDYYGRGSWEGIFALYDATKPGK